MGFTIGSKGYLGTGSRVNGAFKNDFWEYTPEQGLYKNYGAVSINTSMNIFPNPAADQTRVQFELPHSSHVYMSLYCASGKQMSALIDADFEAGYHSININALQLPKGIYLVRMVSEFGIENQKLVVQ